MVVTGPSGVGKSSLINAGLIPRLRNEGWATGSFRPNGLPLDALARALAAVQAQAHGRSPAVTEVGELAALIRSEGLTRPGSRVALTLGRPVLLHAHQLDRRITLAAYHDIGGVAGALSRHADQVYQDMLGRFPAQRIRRVMLALVRSRGGAAEATRRVVPRERIGQDWEVVQALADQRLLTIGHAPAGSTTTPTSSTGS